MTKKQKKLCPVVINNDDLMIMDTFILRIGLAQIAKPKEHTISTEEKFC